MKKLKNKILITIFTILTVSLLIILLIYNSSDYIREKKKIEEYLNIMEPNPKKEDKIPPIEINEEEKKEDFNDIEIDNQRFLDVTLYTVDLDEENKIDHIISHAKELIIPNEVEDLSNKILKTEKTKTYIGNLYKNQYSYKYEVGNKITIIDNTNTNQKLQLNLLYSILVFITFEGIFYLLSDKISKWIIKPAETSFQKQKQFVADASHELKTPLSIIMASAEAYENDKQEKWLNNIKNESNRMNLLIKDLLDLAKLEEKEKLLLEKNNLSKLIEMAILPFESLSYENRISLDYKIEEKIEVECNPNEIKQLVAILLDNALKHTEKNGSIKVTLKRAKENIELEVINKGNPIPKGEEEKIFERFYRGDKSRNRNGNRYGLGLSIAKRIVEKHGGTIKAFSKDGYTTFRVFFKKIKK